MKVRILDEKAIIYSAANSTSEVVGELHVRDEITIGKSFKYEGARKQELWPRTGSGKSCRLG